MRGPLPDHLRLVDKSSSHLCRIGLKVYSLWQRRAREFVELRSKESLDSRPASGLIESALQEIGYGQDLRRTTKIDHVQLLSLHHDDSHDVAPLSIERGERDDATLVLDALPVPQLLLLGY